jgi:4-amino-4-deoxy-L-arabinose transferase-like glycosyltransferase
MVSDPAPVAQRLSSRSPRFAWLAWLAILGLPFLLAVVLFGAIDHDPARGVTFSNSPFSDEAWRALNARNFVLFGSWTTDDWAIHLVQGPLTLVQAAVFSVVGVGLVQARLISVAATVIMATILAVGLRRPLGLAGAFAAAAGAGFSALTLYYGRLALLEPAVALALSGAAIAAIRADKTTIRRWAIVCGISVALAVALKANALPSAIGILLAVAILSTREVELRRFVAITMTTVVIAGLGWVIAVAIPQGAALGDAISLLPTAAIPTGVGEWLQNVSRFIRSNDGVTELAFPLLVGAGVGLLLVAIDRGRIGLTWSAPMSGPGRVALVGVLWAGFGFLSLASFEYQPNRYVVPVLPGLALIVGSGVAVIARRIAERGRLAQVAIAVAVLAFLCGPGLVADAAWGARTGPGALAGQDAVERILPDGIRVAGGYAPLFAMRVPVTTIVQFPGTSVNADDLYASGVRWAFVEDGPPPAWVAGHQPAWEARVERWCAEWGRNAVSVCLVELP